MHGRDGKKIGGQISLQVIVFSAVAMVVLTGFIFLIATFLRISVRSFYKSQAFMIAEAGIEYYRWHLAHNPNDFEDGTGLPGPYLHRYYDKDGVEIGSFSLTITPPLPGSTIVTVESLGKMLADLTVEKTIRVKFGVPSFAKYAVAVNAAVRFGEGTEVFGPIHSNGGIRFDGLAHNLVTSAASNYDDPDHSGGNEYGVHTHVAPVDPLPPTPLPSRPDVFLAGRQVGVPAVDFSAITQDLAEIKTDAQNGGFYASSSGVFGYDLVFATSGVFSVYKVTALDAPPKNCTNALGQSGWGTWSIKSETLVATSAIPVNGKIFIEDNAWVRGKISNVRIIVGSGKFPQASSTMTSITVNSDLRYTNYNGADVIGLIAQNNINAGLKSADVLRVDAALIAQNGRAGRYYYGDKCGAEYKRDQLILYGMIGTNQRYGFAYTDATGYDIRNLIYDANLLYGPPPGFPLSSNSYEQLSWDEVQ